MSPQECGVRNGECGINGEGRSLHDTSIDTPHSALRIPHSGSPESAFELVLGELHDRRSSMDVVRRERRREQPGHELAHLVGIEVLACFDGGEAGVRSEEHTSELQSRLHRVCRLLLEKKKKNTKYTIYH